MLPSQLAAVNARLFDTEMVLSGEMPFDLGMDGNDTPISTAQRGSPNVSLVLPLRSFNHRYQ